VRDALLVFAAQYLYVLLMGLQSLNVNQRRYVWAAVTSFLLGALGFLTTSIVGAAKGMELTLLWWCFVVSGPVGIVSAMHLQPWLVKVFARR
jgi:hypothetical protein